MNIVPQSNRQSFPATLLHACIDEYIKALTALQEEFTAYTITMTLRANYSNMEVVHEEVRQRVHYYMDNLYDHNPQPYGGEFRLYPNGHEAWTYFPIFQIDDSVDVVTVSAQPALPAVGIQIDWSL